MVTSFHRVKQDRGSGRVCVWEGTEGGGSGVTRATRHGLHEHTRCSVLLSPAMHVPAMAYLL